jgi:hypothetical protein
VAISEIITDTISVSAPGEETVYAMPTVGAIAVLFSGADMASGDAFIIRHYAQVAGANTIVASKRIEFGDTDETWDGTFGTDTTGWQSWPFVFGNDGGSITVEWESGATFDIGVTVISVAGAEG